MGTIIAFPTTSTLRSGVRVATGVETGQVLILPVVRIERESDGTNGGNGPDENATPKRRRKRRARS